MDLITIGSLNRALWQVDVELEPFGFYDEELHDFYVFPEAPWPLEGQIPYEGHQGKVGFHRSVGLADILRPSPMDGLSVPKDATGLRIKLTFFQNFSGKEVRRTLL